LLPITLLVTTCPHWFSWSQVSLLLTIKAVDDPRTLNKTLYINPPNNTLSMNEIVTLWEKKIGKSVEKIYMSEEQIFKSIQGSENQFTKRSFDSL
jgi:hypothetical protein